MCGRQVVVMGEEERELALVGEMRSELILGWLLCLPSLVELCGWSICLARRIPGS